MRRVAGCRIRGHPWALSGPSIEGFLLVLQAGVARKFLPDKFISPFSPPILGSKKATLRRDLVMSQNQVMDQLSTIMRSEPEWRESFCPTSSFLRSHLPF